MMPYDSKTKSQTSEIVKFCPAIVECDFLKIMLSAVRLLFSWAGVMAAGITRQRALPKGSPFVNNHMDVRNGFPKISE